MNTHGLLVTGTGGTTALSTTQIGSDITMPAGGPWLIHSLWGQVAKITTIPDQGTAGALTMSSISGDITPDPAPGKYPLPGCCISQSADCAISESPLQMYPVAWSAAGKATLRLSYLNQLAITTGSVLAAGIIFGDAPPAIEPFTFCDGVRASFASTAEQSIGTITLAEKATKIVGIFADLNKGDAATAAEAIVATIRLDSADMMLPPAQYPCNRAFNACDGTAAGQASSHPTNFIPVDIPVVGGARVDCYATTTASVTGNADVQIYLAYI